MSKGRAGTGQAAPSARTRGARDTRRRAAKLSMVGGFALFSGLGVGLGCGVPGVPLGGVCPEVACLDAFEVVIERESVWPAGDYEVEIARDDEVVRCELVFPLDCDAAPPCPEASGVLLDLADCEEPPALWRVALEHGQTPEAVRVSVRRDGSSLASQTFSPSYSRSQPAGMGCLPICDTAPPAALEVEG